MAEIIKTYRQSLGAMRFIGKRYGDDDRVNGMFGAKWGEWFEHDWFGMIEKQAGVDLKGMYEDGGSYIGLMRGGHREPFEYWIGCFVPEDTAVPAGFSFVDFPEGDLGVCWVYGKEAEIYGLEGACAERLKEDGFSFKNGWCFERYSHTRFTEPDEQGNFILDICFYVK